jgi:hypothetical protein
MRTVCLLTLLLAGCGTYTQVQIDLLDQAQRGVQLSRHTLERKAESDGRLAELQRRRLDEAFDADVNDRGELDARWVIEHRIAYAAALGAFWRQQAAAAEADRIASANIDATAEAIARLRWLLSIQMRMAKWGGGMSSDQLPVASDGNRQIFTGN